MRKGRKRRRERWNTGVRRRKADRTDEKGGGRDEIYERGREKEDNRQKRMKRKWKNEKADEITR